MRPTFIAYTLILFSCITLLSVSDVNAKSPFQRGYIVTLNNDSIFGSIQIEQASSNFIRFKNLNENTAITYLPGEISCFYLDNGKYYSTQKVYDNNTTKAVFAEVLYDNDYILYEFGTNKNFRYYIKKSDGTIIILYDENLELLNNYDPYSNNLDFELEEYKAYFKLILADCDTLNLGIKKVAYKASDLVELTNAYITCNRKNLSAQSFKKKFNKPSISFGAFAGIQASKVYVLESQIQSDISTTVPIGAFINLTVPSINKNLSLQSELIYSSLNYSSLNNIPSLYSGINIRTSQVRMPIMLSYKLNDQKLGVSIGIGKEFAYQFNSKVNTIPVSYDFTVPKSRIDFEYRMKGYFVHFSQKEGWFLNLGLDYKLTKKLSLFTHLRLQRNLNLIIEEEQYNNFIFAVAEEKNNMLNPHSNRYRTYAGTLYFGLRF